MNQDSINLIQQYYTAFNNGDMETFLNLLTDDVIHDINQGKREIGKEAFARFMTGMNCNYKEQLADMVIMSTPEGSRAAAEFTVLGEYLKTDGGLPDAKGQKYRLPAGAFFEIRNNKVARITNYYNLQDWVAQVSQ
ncbi:MAG: ketosteroid isomerase-related protein [Methylovulum sp.]|nr:ketosteroid isomerase-related protein [Methylovulum sp.]